LDSEFVIDLLEYLADELRPVIVDDSSGYTDAVKHVMVDELDHFWCLYFLQGDPFREVIRYDQDESMSSGVKVMQENCFEVW